VILFDVPPEIWFTPAGKIHSKEFAAAVAVTVVVNVNSVVVPMNFETSVILVVVIPLVKTNVDGAAGNALVNDKILQQQKFQLHLQH